MHHKFNEYIFQEIPTKLWRGKPIDGMKLGFCETCGFIHTDPYPDDDYLANYYKDYEMPTEQANLSEFARFLSSKVDKNMSVIDMGCGDGGFLFELSKIGFNSLSGFDQSPGLERAKLRKIANLSKNNIFDFINDKNNLNLDYDIYCLIDVFEHIKDPLVFLEKLKKIMKDGSHLLITVPNDFSPLQEAYLKESNNLPWFVCLPDHLNYFNFRTIKNLMNQMNFRIIDTSALYPLELFLLQDCDYVSNPQMGPLAHQKRLKFENTLKKHNMHDVLDDFYHTIAQRGYGRDVVILVKK